MDFQDYSTACHRWLRDQVVWYEELMELLKKNAEDPEAYYVTLATVSPDGTPSSRKVHCRKVLSPPMSDLVFFTDSRSQKVRDLRANKAAEVCWYFPKNRIQFRISGQVDITDAEDDSGSREREWEMLDNCQRRWWLGPTPGEPANNDNILPAIKDEEVPLTPPDSFCLLSLTPLKVDMLDISEAMFCRIMYKRSAAEDEWEGTSVNP